MKRFVSLAAVAGTLAAVLGFAASAGAAGTLPTLNVALTGNKGVTVSGSAVSGAVNIVSTHTGRGHGDFGILRLDPGVSFPQALGAVQSHRGDPNALTPYGGIIADGAAPGALQTVLTPGSYVAVNLSGNGPGGFAPFTVTQSSAPAALPKARSTERTIEFAFRGPRVLHDGTIVRSENQGFLVHMITMIGVRSRAAGRSVMVLLRAGRDKAAQRLATHNFVGLMGPASPGAVQQQVLKTKPGYYVEACFMDTQDRREHTRLGMLRLIRVVR